MLVVLIETWPSQARTVLMDAGEDEMAGRRMPDHMRGYRPSSQFRHLVRAAFDKPIDPEPGERRPEPADEHGVLDRATDDLVGEDAFCFRP